MAVPASVSRASPRARRTADAALAGPPTPTSFGLASDAGSPADGGGDGGDDGGDGDSAAAC